MIRWFLGEAVRRLAAEGYRVFLDFASGLPTVDHIHQVAPKGTKVVYSDLDPVTVAYAQDIIGNNPDVRVIHCDAAKPEELLGSAVVKDLVGGVRKVAIGFNGIAWFMPDEKIRHFMQVTHDWAGEGLEAVPVRRGHGRRGHRGRCARSSDIYKQLRQPLFMRPSAACRS